MIEVHRNIWRHTRVYQVHLDDANYSKLLCRKTTTLFWHTPTWEWGKNMSDFIDRSLPYAKADADIYPAVGPSETRAQPWNLRLHGAYHALHDNVC